MVSVTSLLMIFSYRAPSRVHGASPTNLVVWSAGARTTSPATASGQASTPVLDLASSGHVRDVPHHEVAADDRDVVTLIPEALERRGTTYQSL